MKSENQIAIGSLLATIGSLGIILGLVLKLTELASPWSYILGFVTGLAAGLGSVLSISGLISRRKNMQ